MMDTKTLADRRRIDIIAAFSFSLLFALFAVGAVHANAFAVSPAPTTMAECSKLPVSQVEFCRSQVGGSQTMPNTREIDRTASARAESEVTKCKSLPGSDQDICKAQAGYGQKVPEDLAPNQRIALDKANAQYKAAVARCNQMPASDHNTCVDQAGYDYRLAQAG